MTKFSKVEVTWTDSITYSGWRDYEEALEKTLTHCKSVGYLINKDDSFISIAESHAEEAEQVSDIICIPVVAIQEIVELKRIDE